MSAAGRTIAIVGGGCSGTLTAVALLRRRHHGPTRIVLIERDGEPGRGVAFQRHSYPYLLNVPASRMSANPAVPDEFLQFARARDPAVSTHDFLPRALYGDYLQQLLREAEQAAPAEVRLERRAAEVVGVTAAAPASRFEVALRDSPSVAADVVVLATGHLRPRRVPQLDPVASHPGVLADPWGAPPAYRARERVLVLGSGLTMADVVSAAASAEPTLQLWALSRRGLIPRLQVEPRPAFPGAAAARARLGSIASLRDLLRATRQIAADAAEFGGDWREAVQLVRQLAPGLWRRLSARERARFLRHLRPFWDVHRHRLPPPVGGRLETLIAAGRLAVTAGRLRACAADGDQLTVRWHPRGAPGDRRERVDRIINATGPDTDIASGVEPVWKSLIDGGLALADPLGLGVRTAMHGAMVDASNAARRELYCVGPLLRADHWEAVAVHELSAHAEALARHLAGTPATR